MSPPSVLACALLAASAVVATPHRGGSPPACGHTKTVTVTVTETATASASCSTATATASASLTNELPTGTTLVATATATAYLQYGLNDAAKEAGKLWFGTAADIPQTGELTDPYYLAQFNNTHDFGEAAPGASTGLPVHVLTSPSRGTPGYDVSLLKSQQKTGHPS